MHDSLKIAIDHYGSQSALGRALRKRQSVVQYWCAAGKALAAEDAVALEQESGGELPRWKTRPDLFEQPLAAE